MRLKRLSETFKGLYEPPRAGRHAIQRDLCSFVFPSCSDGPYEALLDPLLVNVV